MSKGLKCRIIEDGGRVVSVLSELGVHSKLYSDIVNYVKSKTTSSDVGDVLDNAKTAVREQAIFRGKYLLAPNGELSNQTQSQWELVRSKPFLEAFEGSDIKFKRDENGDIIFTNEPNSIETGDGVEISEQEVENLLSSNEVSNDISKQALILWGIANSDSMMKALGTTSEPTFTQFMEYYSRFGDGSPLTSKDKEGIISLLSTIDESLPQYILSHLNDKGAKELWTRLRNTDLKNEPVITPTIKDGIISQIEYITSNNPVLGKKVTESPTAIWEQLDRAYMYNVYSEEDIVSNASTLPYSISDSIVQNKQLQKDLYNYYKNLEYVDVATIQDGILSFEEVNKRIDTSLNSIILDRGVTKKLKSTLEVLTSLSKDVWDSSVDIIPDKVLEVEKEALKVNLDLLGLGVSVATKDYATNMTFLSELKELVDSLHTGITTEDELTRFKKAYEQYLGTQSEPITKSVRNAKDLSLLSLEDTPPTGELFSSYGIVKHKDSLYAKVNKEQLYNNLMNRKTPNLPEYLYENSETITPAIQENIAKFFDKLETSSMFNSREENIKYNMARYMLEDSSFDVRSDLYRYIPDGTDLLDSTTGLNNIMLFPSKFATRLYSERGKNSNAYNRVLKYFYVNKDGVQVDGDLSTIRQEFLKAESLWDLRGDLLNHALVTNNMDLLSIVADSIATDIRTPNNLVQIANNKLVKIPEYLGKYTTPNPNTLITDRYAGEVINLKGTTWYISDRGSNEYSTVPITNPTEQTPNIGKTPKYSSMSVVSPISREVMRDINDRIDLCS